MGRKSKFSKEVKVRACESYNNGHGSFKSIAREVGCSRERIRQWTLDYHIHGPMAFESRPTNRSYSKTFKVAVVKSYLAGEYSLPDLSAKHMISHSMVRRWINKYNGGIELKTYTPKSEAYTMKSRKTTYEERLEIVN